MASPLKSLALVILLASISFVLAANDCAPSTWSQGAIVKIRQVTSSATSPVSSSDSLSLSITSSASISTGTSSTSTTSTSSVTSTAISILSSGNVTTGEVNCRYSATTDSTVNYYTCSSLSNFYGITNEVFFTLNPELALDCSNILPNTQYCVAGWLHPKVY
ncbi:hypothetical protein BJ166DRAFT_610970 [Pestalotiopsis sp. NC0098]|nr:hypothetical protein BJ166DRAFT_610970 [Pestalotiopsis sp. NC0098]